MTDWATTRLFMTGPQDELMRFKTQCIHAVPDEDCAEEIFDFNTLVPMPDDVKLTMVSPGAVRAVPPNDSIAAIDWYHWRTKYWGTKWLPSSFAQNSSSDNIYDCIFDTPWRCPHPVIEALAIAYPKLNGFTVSHIHSDDTGEIGLFSDAVYHITEIGEDFSYDDPVDCGCTCSCDCVDDIQPEISRIIWRSHLCWDDFEGDVRDALAWADE